MRVCHIVRQYEPSTGGLETFTATLVQNLAELGCKNTVVTLDRLFTDPSETLLKREIVGDVLVRRVPFIGHRRMFTPIIEQSLLKRFDVLHVHGIDGMFERVARQHKREGQVRIATSHGLFFHTPFMRTLKKAYFASITRLAALSYDGLIANGQPDAEHLAKLGRDLTIIPNGVAPIGSFMAKGGDLLYIGRLSSHKRIERLIDVMAEASLADARLHIVGPDWDVTATSLKAHALAKGVADRVVLHGKLSAEELADVARQCAVFVSASEYEGFGMSLIEAMSVGLSPVVEANASFTQLVQGAGIGAVTSFAEPAYAAALIALERATLAPAKRAAAMAYARRFSWASHARATLNYYEARLRHSFKNAPASAPQMA